MKTLIQIRVFDDIIQKSLERIFLVYKLSGIFVTPFYFTLFCSILQITIVSI